MRALTDDHALEQSFLCEKEADNLFKAEADREPLPSLAGVAMLYISLTLHGNRSGAFKYIQETTTKVARMKLFEDVPTLASSQSASLSQETLAATSRTAWGVFNMIV
jgi:hypothetical protein